MNDRVQSVFLKLKKDGLIDERVKLKSKPKLYSFKASAWRRKTILYDPKTNALSEDSISFALLHECGHMENPQNWKLVLAFDVVVVIASWLMSIFYSGVESTPSSPLVYGLMPIYLAFFLVSVRIFTVPFQKDEYNADLYAAMMLRERYNLKKPDETLKKLLNELDMKKLDDGLIARYARLFFGGIHPSDLERVGYIKSKIND